MSTDKENYRSLFGSRLSEERKRVGAKQAKAAELCGVSREIWGKYERGITTPGCDVLFLFSQAGADVLYILTGQRGLNDMKPDEVALVDNYRHCPPDGKVALQTTSAALSKQASDKTRHG